MSFRMLTAVCVILSFSAIAGCDSIFHAEIRQSSADLSPSDLSPSDLGSRGCDISIRLSKFDQINGRSVTVVDYRCDNGRFAALVYDPSSSGYFVCAGDQLYNHKICPTVSSGYSFVDIRLFSFTKDGIILIYNNPNFKYCDEPRYSYYYLNPQNMTINLGTSRSGTIPLGPRGGVISNASYQLSWRDSSLDGGERDESVWISYCDCASLPYPSPSPYDCVRDGRISTAGLPISVFK